MCIEKKLSTSSSPPSHLLSCCNLVENDDKMSTWVWATVYTDLIPIIISSPTIYILGFPNEQVTRELGTKSNIINCNALFVRHIVCIFIGLCKAVATSAVCCASHHIRQYYNEIHTNLYLKLLIVALLLGLKWWIYGIYWVLCLKSVSSNHIWFSLLRTTSTDRRNCCQNWLSAGLEVEDGEGKMPSIQHVQ